MPTLSLHIGYTKTGTTYLQKEVFMQVPNVHYLDKPSIDLIPQKLSGDGIFRRFFAAAPPIWDEHGRDLLNALAYRHASAHVGLGRKCDRNDADAPAGGGASSETQGPS